MDLNDKKEEIKSILFLLNSDTDLGLVKGVEVEPLLKEKREEMLSLIGKTKSMYIAKSLKPYITQIDNLLIEINK